MNSDGEVSLIELSDCLDSTDHLQSRNVSAVGKKISLCIRRPSAKILKDIVILKSDVAYISIPSLELEEGPGTGRYATLEDIINQMGEKLTGSSSYYPGLDMFIRTLREVTEGLISFTFEIDDPIALSSIKLDNINKEDVEITEEEYTRTWDQNSDLGLLNEVQNNEAGDSGVDKLVDYIKNAKKIVAFTGAGISVESGIPSYRGSENSIWNKFDETVANIDKFLNDVNMREQYWAMKTEFFELLRKAEPNDSHNIFAHLEKMNKLHGIITQNIDGLHERAGVSPNNIINLHGTEIEVKCQSCLALFDREEIHQKIKGGEAAPSCSVCGGILKPCTVFFGEPLDKANIQRAEKLCKECDLLIVAGSSLVVQPANRLPSICLNRNIPVVIINKEGETKYDSYATLVIRQPSGQVMKEVTAKLSK